MKRRWLVLVALALGIIAGWVVFDNYRVVPAVVAAGDLALGERLTLDSVDVRDVHPGSLPAGAYTSAASVAGHYVTGPVPEGQFIVAGQLATSRQGALLAHSWPVPAGYALVAVPVNATRALGGALKPSQSVDVLVVDVLPKAGSDGVARSRVEILGRGVLLVDLRSDSGDSVRSPDGAAPSRGPSVRIASAVLAVPAADVARYVERIPTGTFVLSVRLPREAAEEIEAAPAGGTSR